MSCLVLFCACVFCPFSIAITSLGEERASHGAFREFVRFALVWFCQFLLPLGVREGLRFVIVALPGFFSYHCLAFWEIITVMPMSIRELSAELIESPENSKTFKAMM